ncbi:sulfotransferase domain-containing protein [Evansella tamaricis]|uniref:Sulfotransferase domain-containing protein n=1 Tax=Evansella tamaricis TaxID=2069301 RepID=A0ABS6JI30_9BACI|nr:sulfotransferase domain-containing protein [Evansella tamaricis]MBU9713320.1 sulfotransferase domain-containing protein [Evansella tamaricis]
MDKGKKDVIITGTPRGGTTLTGAMFDQLDNCICLSEPVWQEYWLRKINDQRELTEKIIQDFKKMRKRIEQGMPVKDRRNPDGSPPTNYYQKGVAGKRKADYRKPRQIVFRVKNKEFLLAMKHNTLYTAILPSLLKSGQFTIIAVLRHPIPTILSWNSVGKYTSQRVKLVESHWGELKNLIRGEEDLINKQVKIFDLYCQMYLSLQDQIQLIKYEDLIYNPTKLEKLTNRTFTGEHMLKKASLRHYDFSLVDRIKKSLRAHAPNALKLYSLDDF